jgi:hypothetical protein
MRGMGFVLLLLAALASGPARADEAPGAADQAQIRQVIGDQLDAFRHDDGERAFGYASPGIRAMFHDPDTFMRMVRTGYQPVYRPREVEFRDLDLEEGTWVQRVLLVGPDGVPVVARYLMQRQPDGSWLINGCVLEKSPDTTT